MRQDQKISDLTALGIQGCQDLDPALHRATSLELKIWDTALGTVMIRSQDHEDTLDIHACESFGCS